MLELVALPLPRRALAVVHEAKEPVRGRHAATLRVRLARGNSPCGPCTGRRGPTTTERGPLADVRLLGGVTLAVPRGAASPCSREQRRCASHGRRSGSGL